MHHLQTFWRFHLFSKLFGILPFCGCCIGMNIYRPTIRERVTSLSSWWLTWTYFGSHCGKCIPVLLTPEHSTAAIKSIKKNRAKEWPDNNLLLCEYASDRLAINKAPMSRPSAVHYKCRESRSPHLVQDKIIPIKPTIRAIEIFLAVCPNCPICLISREIWEN